MNLLDIMERGDIDFEALSEVEKDLYSLLLFQLTHEMEGFTHFFATDRNVHLPRLLALLNAGQAPGREPVQEITAHIERQVGSWEPDKVAAYLTGADETRSEQFDAWGDRFYSELDSTWVRVREHVRETHGVEVDP